jgi:hypothetical protein
MTRRILPVEEWERLAGTELETVWPTLDPLHTKIIVVEDEDEIVGCWAFLVIPHVEGLWIDPDVRGSSVVARHLWMGMKELTEQVGAYYVWTAAVADPVRGLLKHANARKLEGDHYVMPMRSVH